jgi:hypothetical protein
MKKKEGVFNVDKQTTAQTYIRIDKLMPTVISILIAGLNKYPKYRKL